MEAPAEFARRSAGKDFVDRQALGRAGRWRWDALPLDIHAAVGVPASDREGRERLLRYCARARLSLERLAVLPNGRLAYRIKAPRGKQTHRVLTPLQFLARLRAHPAFPSSPDPLIRFHGVFASCDGVWMAYPPQPSETPMCAAESLVVFRANTPWPPLSRCQK